MKKELENELGNAILFLVPETEVIPYYQSLGFELQTATMGWEYSLKKMDEANEMEIELLWSAEEYDNIRQVWLRRRMNETGQGFVLWDKLMATALFVCWNLLLVMKTLISLEWIFCKK